MNPNNILVMILNFNNSASYIPTGRLVATLVLNLNSIMNLQRVKSTCSMLKTLSIS